MTAFSDLDQLITNANAALTIFDNATKGLINADGSTISIESMVRGIVDQALQEKLPQLTPTPQGGAVLPLESDLRDQNISYRPYEVVNARMNPLIMSLPNYGDNMASYKSRLSNQEIPTMPQNQSEELTSLKSEVEMAKARANEALDKTRTLDTAINHVRMETNEAKNIAMKALSKAESVRLSSSAVAQSNAETPYYVTKE